MKATLLLVTWFVAGQAPSSYHVQFGSAAACQNARAAILADAKRIAGELWVARGPPKPPPGYKVERTAAPVEVSAICVPLVAE
jgi:hypothetical protein